nr:MAG TPA: hypothetical protein [Caudoviricetes sp.]
MYFYRTWRIPDVAVNLVFISISHVFSISIKNALRVRFPSPALFF